MNGAAIKKYLMLLRTALAIVGSELAMIVLLKKVCLNNSQLDEFTTTTAITTSTRIVLTVAIRTPLEPSARIGPSSLDDLGSSSGLRPRPGLVGSTPGDPGGSI